MSSAGGRSGAGREPIWTAAFVAVFVANVFQEIAWSLFLHLPGYLSGLGAAETEIGIVMGIAATSSILARPWIGRAMDTWGRRPVILVGNLIHVAVLAAYIPLDGIGPALYAVRVAHGLAAAMLFTVMFTYAADVVPASRRTEGLALFGLSGLVPIGLGGIVGDLVISVGGYGLLFRVAVAFAVMALLLALPLPEVAPVLGRDATPVRFRDVVVHGSLVPLWMLAFVFALALAAVFSFLRVFLDDLGVGSVGLFFGVYTATAVAIRLVGGGLADRVGPIRVLVPAFVAIAIGLGLLAVASTELHVALAGLFAGAGHGYAFPIMYAAVVTRAPVRLRGSASAAFTALFDIGLLLGGPTFGAIAETRGFRTMWTVAAVVVLIGLVVFLRLDARATTSVIGGDAPSARPSSG